MKSLGIAATLAAVFTSICLAAESLPGVDEAIPAPIKTLGEPAMQSFAGGIELAVSASSENAQAHVLHGLNYLHGGWDLEASRHFAAAMRDDPNCLLAHWGMVMCLLNPTPETSPARHAATERMLELVNQGCGSELERGYAFGLVKYLEEGSAGAANAFRKVAARFPNDLQAGIFAALFGRGGFDANGDPTPDQEAAENSLRRLIAAHPQSPLPLNALLMIHAEAPNLTDSLELARGLCRLTPDYPPAQHVLGHYAWRCGQHREAGAAFGRAASLYQQWMQANHAGLADCPEWTKAECYRIVAQYSQGETDSAYAAARKLAATPIPADRPASTGARMLMWDAQTLPARILLSQGARPKTDRKAKVLPPPADMKRFHPHSHAYWWLDSLRFALETQRLLDAGKREEARKVIGVFTQHGEAMAATQAAAAARGERSDWLRAFRATEILASELRGRLAMAGPANLRPTAYNWFAAASDRQSPAPLLMPPLLLSPMAAHLGEFHLADKKPDEAIEAYQRALAAFPNNLLALAGLKRAYEAAGKTADASAVAKLIAELTRP